MFFLPHAWADEDDLQPRILNDSDIDTELDEPESASEPEEDAAPTPETPATFYRGELPLNHPIYRSGGFVVLTGRGFRIPSAPRPTILEGRLARVREDTEHIEKVCRHLDRHANWLEENALKFEAKALMAPDDEEAQEDASSGRYWADQAREEAREQEEYLDYLWDLIDELEAQVKEEQEQKLAGLEAGGNAAGGGDEAEL